MGAVTQGKGSTLSSVRELPKHRRVALLTGGRENRTRLG